MSLLERLGKKKTSPENEGKKIIESRNSEEISKNGGLGKRLNMSRTSPDDNMFLELENIGPKVPALKQIKDNVSDNVGDIVVVEQVSKVEAMVTSKSRSLTGLFGRTGAKGSSLSSRLISSNFSGDDNKVALSDFQAKGEKEHQAGKIASGLGTRLLHQESDDSRLSENRIMPERAAVSHEGEFSAEAVCDEDEKTEVSLGVLGAKLGMTLRSGLGERLGKKQEKVIEAVAEVVSKPSLMAKKAGIHPAAEQDQYQGLKLEVHRQIVEELSIEQRQIIANSNSDRMELQRIVVELCNRVIDNGDNPMAISRADRANIVNDLVDEVLGLGPIEPLLKDDTISEVMINGPKMVYVERKGKLTLTNVQFQDETHLMNIIERIVAPLGRRIDESSPLVDARLADGSRVNIIIPPLALNGACVTIRKFSKDPLTINNLIGFGSLTEEMASLIKACVLGRLNIVVSGGTGSGKTTTLNVLSSFIPEDERIVTIEDAAELQLRQDHVVTLESRPANVEGTGQIAIRDLVRNSLRMRPDRIVVGEVRSGEALDMLQAMNTGHDGSLTTAHANTPRDVISRLETMVLMAGMDLPVRAIREQIASAVDLIIQQSRLRDGSRKITHITEVQGMEGDVIVLQDLFTFEQAGLDENGKLQGSFCTSGIRPKFLEKLETNGIKVDYSMFQRNMGWDV